MGDKPPHITIIIIIYTHVVVILQLSESIEQSFHATAQQCGRTQLSDQSSAHEQFPRGPDQQSWKPLDGPHPDPLSSAVLYVIAEVSTEQWGVGLQSKATEKPLPWSHEFRQ